MTARVDSERIHSWIFEYEYMALFWAYNMRCKAFTDMKLREMDYGHHCLIPVSRIICNHHVKSIKVMEVSLNYRCSWDSWIICIPMHIDWLLRMHSRCITMCYVSSPLLSLGYCGHNSCYTCLLFTVPLYPSCNAIWKSVKHTILWRRQGWYERVWTYNPVCDRNEIHTKLCVSWASHPTQWRRSPNELSASCTQL